MRAYIFVCLLAAVGGAHEDRVREVYAYMGFFGWVVGMNGSGAFYSTGNYSTHAFGGGSNNGRGNLVYDNNRVVPTGNYAVPRAFGVMACIYLGS